MRRIRCGYGKMGTVKQGDFTMDLRYAFDEDAKNYDRARPGYVKELFEDIFEYSSLKNGDKVLEIGMGTGQATLPFLIKGCNVTAVELGGRLASYSREKFASYQNLEIKNADFLECALENHSFSLAYSATAFHWIPKKEGYFRAASLLRPQGALALFWNHPYPNRLGDKTNEANRRVYEKYRPANRSVSPFDEAACEIKKRELEENGFTDVKTKLYRRVRTLSAEDYIALINTYSDHLALPLRTRLAFESDMRDALDVLGGKINIYDTIDLYLARTAKSSM